MFINPEEQRVSLDGKHWHATSECFACAVCFVPLIGRKMTKKFGLILCSSACSRKAAEDMQRSKEPLPPPVEPQTAQMRSLPGGGEVSVRGMIV